MGAYEIAEANRKGLPGLAAAVAAELGADWRADVREHLVHVKRAGTDEALHLSVTWNKPTMVRVAGVYPEGSRDVYGLEHHSINVGGGRGAAAIAREITRRLMPAYLVELVKAQAGIARNGKARDRQREVADAIAESHPHLWRSKDGVDFSSGYKSSGPSFRLTVREGGSVAVDRVYGDADAMMGVVAALAATCREG